MTNRTEADVATEILMILPRSVMIDTWMENVPAIKAILLRHTDAVTAEINKPDASCWRFLEKIDLLKQQLAKVTDAAVAVTVDLDAEKNTETALLKQQLAEAENEVQETIGGYLYGYATEPGEEGLPLWGDHIGVTLAEELVRKHKEQNVEIIQLKDNVKYAEWGKNEWKSQCKRQKEEIEQLEKELAITERDRDTAEISKYPAENARIEELESENKELKQQPAEVMKPECETCNGTRRISDRPSPFSSTGRYETDAVTFSPCPDCAEATKPEEPK